METYNLNNAYANYSRYQTNVTPINNNVVQNSSSDNSDPTTNYQDYAVLTSVGGSLSTRLIGGFGGKSIGDSILRGGERFFRNIENYFKKDNALLNSSSTISKTVSSISERSANHLQKAVTPVKAEGIAAKLDLDPAIFKKVGMLTALEMGVFGGASAIKNGYDLSAGKIDGGTAGANIVTDVVRGAASGLGAAAGGGTASMIARLAGATGTVGTVIAFVGGMIGATMADVVDRTGLRGFLIEKFTGKSETDPMA